MFGHSKEHTKNIKLIFKKVIYLWNLLPSVAGEESDWEERRNGWLHSRVFRFTVQQVSLNTTGTLYTVPYIQL